MPKDEENNRKPPRGSTSSPLPAHIIDQVEEDTEKEISIMFKDIDKTCSKPEDLLAASSFRARQLELLLRVRTREKNTFKTKYGNNLRNQLDLLEESMI